MASSSISRLGFQEFIYGLQSKTYELEVNMSKGNSVMEKIKIIATGDFCPTVYVEEKINSIQDPYEMFGEALHLLRSGDLTITNLEYPLTDSNEELKKFGPHLRGHPSTISIIKLIGIDIISLANNHIMDYGEQGLKDTLNLCEAHSISTVGAGMTREAAQKVLYKEVKGVKISFIAFCENEFSIASKNHAGAAPMDLIDNLRSIQEAKNNSDFVVVIVHGGNEYSHYPNPRIVKQYRFYIDQGASLVIGHHSHFIQGLEFYSCQPILYSLGHLIYKRRPYPASYEIPIAEIMIDPNTLDISVEYHFFRISSEEMKLIEFSHPEERELRERFDRYCNVIKDPAALDEEWKNYCKSKEETYYQMLFIKPKIIEKIFNKLRLTGVFTKIKRVFPCELLRLLNVVRCESHRDVVLSLLSEENGLLEDSY